MMLKNLFKTRNPAKVETSSVTGSLKTLVLHLGAHKTGTSAIQKYMRDNAALCARNGIAFLDRSKADGLLRWGKQASINAHADELRALIQRAEAGGAQHYVISHENVPGRPICDGASRLYPRIRAQAGFLRDALGDWPRKVVFYIRSQPAFLESYYLQTIHEGRFHTFREWRQAMGKVNFSWQPVYDDLCAVFGPENVMLRSFDNDIAEGQAHLLGQFFGAFCDSPAEAFDNFAYPAHRNPSIGSKGLEMALLINPLLDSRKERRPVRDFLQEHFSNRDYSRPRLMAPERKVRMAERYASSDAAILAASAAAYRSNTDGSGK